MKQVLGLDIGVNSVGFALIQINTISEDSAIITSGVRIVNEDPDFHGKFYTGNKASKNAGRTTKRMIRRLNNRYKHRRDDLIEVLEANGMMPDDDLMNRITSIEIYGLRDRATEEKVSLQELGRIWLHLNHKRGFLSNRKSKSDEESSSEYLQKVHQLEQLVADSTIGSYFYNQLLENPYFRVRENVFPRAAFIKEFDVIWQEQQKHYPELLTGGPEDSKRSSLYQLVRNEIIYFQRPLKSQKHLVSFCRFEPQKKVAPKSSPLFQLFRIWQQLNNLEARTIDNISIKPDEAQKKKLLSVLNDPTKLSARGTLAYSKILKLMDAPKDCILNYNLLEGNKTIITIYNALKAAGIENPEQYLFFYPFDEDEKGGLQQLWHITYSLPTEKDVINSLQKHFRFTKQQTTAIAAKTGYTADYGKISAKAIRKILPHLETGLHYDKACKEAGYEHTDLSEFDENRPLIDKLPPIKQNSLRNPVVEQILNQVVNVVNTVAERYGKPDEIRIELARELKNNAKQRQRLTSENKNLRRKNDFIVQRLLKEHGFKRVNARDLLRYRLWEETGQTCLYSGKPISFTELYNGVSDIEHILPRSRSFSNGMSNFIIAYNKENKAKDQMTAYDYMKSKGDVELKNFIDRVNQLYTEQKITKSKRDNLLCPGAEIPSDFLQRQLKDTQYTSRESVKMLKSFCKKVTTTTGTVTDFLRDHWELTHVMKEINMEKYRALNQTFWRTIKDNSGREKQVEDITDFTKRDDHRHHAVDAILVALTSQSIIQRLNNLNQEFETYKELKRSALAFAPPITGLREQVKHQLENILVSFKKPNSKVLSKKINRYQTASGTAEQETWVPRGSLHEDTVMGKLKWYKKIPLDKKFTLADAIVHPELKEVIKQRLAESSGDAKKAFANLKKHPLLFKNVPVTEVVVWDEKFTKRVAVSDTITPAQVTKIVDAKIKRLLEERISGFSSIKEAFKDYASKPIYLDEAKTIPIKSVTVFDEGNLVQVREGFVYTKGNHHAIIYTDGNGNFLDKVVPFWDAVEACLNNLKNTGTIYPIIDKGPAENSWRFYTSLQINDLFVIGLNPAEVDFKDPKNRSLLAKHLYRVQKMSKGDYYFRHQFESTLKREEAFAMRRIKSLKMFTQITKVRLNHLGEILTVETEQ